MLLGMIGLAFVWLSQVPFRLAEVWWDRRYDQTDSGYLETLFANWIQLGAEFLFICFALVVVMALAGRVPTPLVARSGAVLRRARDPVRLHLPVPDPDRAAPPRRPDRGRTGVRCEAGDRSRSAAGRGRHGLHERSERLRGRLRAEQANRLLEHASRRQLHRQRGEDRARARARPSLEQPPDRGHRVVRALRAARAPG